MHFHLPLMVSLVAGLVTAAPAAPAAPQDDVPYPSFNPTCQLDEMLASGYQRGGWVGCAWWVCAGNNQWRLVRDCGTHMACWQGHPTSCKDPHGGPF